MVECGVGVLGGGEGEEGWESYGCEVVGKTLVGGKGGGVSVCCLLRRGEGRSGRWLTVNRPKEMVPTNLERVTVALASGMLAGWVLMMMIMMVVARQTTFYRGCIQKGKVDEWRVVFLFLRRSTLLASAARR